MTTPSDDPHGSDSKAGPHGAGDHGEDHGRDDHAHGHGDGDGRPLGPIDMTAWGAGIVGIGAGLVVAAVLAASTGWLG